MCLDGWFKLKWSICSESVTRKVLEYFGTFPGSLYIKPWHANTDLFTMSDKWNITVWSKIPACESNTVMVVNQWLILISFLMSDKWDRTASVHSFDRFHSPSIWWSSISHALILIYFWWVKSKQYSVCRTIPTAYAYDSL